MVRINFVIPCSRLDNLEYVLDSVIEDKTDDVDSRIIVVFDKNEDELTSNIVKKLKSIDNLQYAFKKDERNKIGGGYLCKNLGIDMSEFGWIYILDDDNLLYPGFTKRINEIITTNPDKQCIIFSQVNRFRAVHPGIKLGTVDTAMCIFNKELLGDIRYKIARGADGLLITKLYNEFNDKCLLVDEFLCTYNALRRMPIIKFSDFKILTYNVGWGELGLRGSLGYGNRKVDPYISLPKYEVLSAHAPSSIRIKFKPGVYNIVGMYNKGVSNRSAYLDVDDTTLFNTDNMTMQQLWIGSDRTVSVNIRHIDIRDNQHTLIAINRIG
jgi:glycosyltransferase involved in cell wall biosynthesis